MTAPSEKLGASRALELLQRSAAAYSGGEITWVIRAHEYEMWFEICGRSRWGRASEGITEMMIKYAFDVRSAVRLVFGIVEDAIEFAFIERQMG